MRLARKPEGDLPKLLSRGPLAVRKLRLIAGTGIAIAVIGIAVLSLLKEISDRRPSDLVAMRQYRISLLTDDEIRKMHADAEHEFQKIQRDAVDEDKAFWRQYSPARTQSDVAYRMRHSDECRMPLTWQSNGKPLDQRSIEQIFEAKMLGICNLAFTVGQARRYGGKKCRMGCAKRNPSNHMR